MGDVVLASADDFVTRNILTLPVLFTKENNKFDKDVMSLLIYDCVRWSEPMTEEVSAVCVLKSQVIKERSKSTMIQASKHICIFKFCSSL